MASTLFGEEALRPAAYFFLCACFGAEELLLDGRIALGECVVDAAGPDECDPAECNVEWMLAVRF
jgi:hypothetical protein